jgi:hypothetical protein
LHSLSTTTIQGLSFTPKMNRCSGQTGDDRDRAQRKSF